MVVTIGPPEGSLFDGVLLLFRLVMASHISEPLQIENAVDPEVGTSERLERLR